MGKQLLCPPLRDEFTKFGDKFVKIAHNEANGMYCYERYPSSSEFGFGAVLCIRNDKSATDKIAFCISNGFTAGRFQA